jgi:hypothetical protein
MAMLANDFKSLFSIQTQKYAFQKRVAKRNKEVCLERKLYLGLGFVVKKVGKY